MTRAAADKTIQDTLRSLSHSAEVCAPQGQTLAHLLSPAFFEEVMRAWVFSRITPEEIARRRLEPSRSLAEIVKDLKQP